MDTKNIVGRSTAEVLRGGWLLAAMVLMPLLGHGAAEYQTVTTERLANAQQDTGWLMYRRNYESTGYAPFDQINTANVAQLKIAFDHKSDLSQGHEAAPVVNGKYLFVTTPMDHVIAMDATNGKVLWQYEYPLDKKALKTVCCDVVNRGVATASSPAGYFLKVADVTAPQPVDKNLGPPPALYTKEQAKKGVLGYLQNCASCHGPALDGQPGGYSGPALKGAEFADPSYDFHVSDIFNFVAKLMPSATPGSLPPDVYVAIMAFILQQNGYPAGSRELTYDEAMTSSVPIRYYGKSP